MFLGYRVWYPDFDGLFFTFLTVLWTFDFCGIIIQFTKLFNDDYDQAFLCVSLSIYNNGNSSFILIKQSNIVIIWNLVTYFTISKRYFYTIVFFSGTPQIGCKFAFPIIWLVFNVMYNILIVTCELGTNQNRICFWCYVVIKSKWQGFIFIKR